MSQSAGSSAESRLRDAGLRRTSVRLGVLEVLARGDRSLDVPQIIAKLPGQIDAVTVYRTLNTFTRKKLVHRVRGEDRAWRYALNDAGHDKTHQHPHFVCDECGRVECLTQSRIPGNLVGRLKLADGYAVSHSELLLHGVCPRCRR